MFKALKTLWADTYSEITNEGPGPEEVSIPPDQVPEDVPADWQDDETDTPSIFSASDNRRKSS